MRKFASSSSLFARETLARLDMTNSTAMQSAPKLRHYRAYGISICSELLLPLPEIRGAPESALLELEIRASEELFVGNLPEPSSLQHNPLSGYDFGQIPDGSSYVRWDDIGEVLISKNGRSVACRPFHLKDSEAFQVYLLGQALSFAMVNSGFEPLHATAVEVDNQAVAFLGDCGFGKSTLAAAFLQAGHRLLTDDLLLLQTTMQGILAFPGPARIKLFPEVARKFLGQTSGGVPLNSKAQKQIIPLHDMQVCGEAVPLGGIYALVPSNNAHDKNIRVESLTQRQTFITLLGSTFNRAIIDPERLRRQFEATQALANATIVRRLYYPRSLELLPSVREAILADLSAGMSATVTCKA